MDIKLKCYTITSRQSCISSTRKRSKALIPTTLKTCRETIPCETFRKLFDSSRQCPRLLLRHTLVFDHSATFSENKSHAYQRRTQDFISGEDINLTKFLAGYTVIAYDTSKKMSLWRYSIPICNKLNFCTFTTVLAFTELVAYSASVVKSEFGNFCGIKSINPFIAPIGHANDAYRVLFPAATLSSNNLRQVVYTYVPLSPSSITWYRPKGGDALRLGR